MADLMYIATEGIAADRGSSSSVQFLGIIDFGRSNYPVILPCYGATPCSLVIEGEEGVVILHYLKFNPGHIGPCLKRQDGQVLSHFSQGCDVGSQYAAGLNLCLVWLKVDGFPPIINQVIGKFVVGADGDGILDDGYLVLI